MPDELVTFGGDAVKALDETGKIGGYLVVFSSASEPDLAGDFFTAETDFGTAQKSAVLFHHALDGTVNYPIGEVELKKTDVGVWAEGYLNLRDKYVQAIWQMVKAGKLGWSSGTVPHLVEREPVGNAKRVKRWWLGLDASLTPTPAEPRTQALSLKALMDDMGGEPEAQAEADAQSAPVQVSADETAPEVKDHLVTIEENPMTDEMKAQLDAMQAEIAALKSAPAIPSTPAAVAVAGERDEIKSFSQYLRTGRNDGNLKALAEGSASTGGVLVPQQYRDQLVTALNRTSDLRRAGARVVQAPAGYNLSVPVANNSTRAVITSEGSGYSEIDPSTANVPITAYKYTRLTRVSEELMADSRFDVMNSIIMPDIQNAYVLAENVDFVTGNGSTAPQGVVTGSSLGKTAASATAITADEVIDLFYSLDEQYRQNAVWLLNGATEKLIRQLKGSDGQYIWAQGLGATPATLLGRPVFPSSGMPTPATGQKTIIFGDLSYYMIVEYGDMMMRRLDERYADSGQVGFISHKRLGGAVTLSAAIKHLIQA